jgi:hypothetical protein
MSRNLPVMRVFALCLTTAAYCYPQAGESSKDVQAVQGLWIGSYGGGQRDGVTFQPAIAEMFIQGDQIEVYGYPSNVAGTFRVDPKAKQLEITASDDAGGKATMKTHSYAYQVKGDELTIIVGGKPSITFRKRDALQAPQANAQVELVTAEEINKAGDLLVTEFSELEAGRVRATYFEPRRRTLKTQQATVLVVQKTGCKKISLAEARDLIRRPMPVVVTYRQDDRRPPEDWRHLSKETGPAAPDGAAVGRTFSGLLQPGTLVFVLSAKENVPVP